MKTGTGRLLNRVLLAAAVALAAQLLAAGAGMAEQDHMKGYKSKDLNKVVGGIHSFADRYGTDNCELKKPAFLMVRSEKDAGDDPRGGVAKDYVCYKAKCAGGLLPVQDASSQVGVHSMEAKKPQLVCLPVGLCELGGDNTACQGYGDVSCSTCCDANAACQAACSAADGSACLNAGLNSNCAEAAVAADCAHLCCP
jgi:hypothetical protein